LRPAHWVRTSLSFFGGWKAKMMKPFQAIVGVTMIVLVAAAAATPAGAENVLR
jgi:hypothetical protein